MKDGFTVSFIGQPFISIPCDEVIEMTVNTSIKSTERLSLKSSRLFCLILIRLVLH